ncbi:family 10 glycosylhydrolase, partial [Arthrospira platensis SPKY1]|nr:family 10 glycosylhydrolase [Arthrospira platensis SPKY1]
SSGRMQYAPTPSSPIRGFWLTNVASDVLYSREGIRQAVATAHELGFNTIYVVTWNKGYTVYPSRIMQQRFGQAIIPDLEGRDPLRELIEEAKPKGIRVIA